MRRRTTSKLTAIAAVAVMILAPSAAVAGQGVQIGLRDAPTAGSTGVLSGKAYDTPKRAGTVQQQGADVSQRPDPGSGGSGTGTDGGAAVGIQVQDTAQAGGGWVCRMLQASPLNDYVEIALLCD